MKFSIITVSLNAQDLIADTINSVLNQTFTDFEIIVKDGCSKDATLDRIPKDDRIRVVVKEDKGIYQAMNQGIAEARGEYLLFLNCGDTLYDNTVLQKAAAALEGAGVCILYGDRYSEDIGFVSYPAKIKKSYLYYSTICHQASFISRELFDTVALYDETLKIASDWKFFVMAKCKNVKYIHCSEVFCQFLSGGVSETEKGIAIAGKERASVIAEYYSVLERAYARSLSSRFAKFLIGIKHKILG